MIEGLISYLLANFTLTFFIVGLICSAVSLWRRARPLTPALVVEDLFAYFLLFSVGAAYFYNFVFHVFFGDMAAKFIGWEQSPFQAELGWASLGFSVLGFMAFRGDFSTRAAAVIGLSCFLLGAAAGHVREMVVAHNYAPGNAGVIFYTDILIPLAGLTLLWLQRRLGRERSAAGGLSPGMARS